MIVQKKISVQDGGKGVREVGGKHGVTVTYTTHGHTHAHTRTDEQTHIDTKEYSHKHVGTREGASVSEAVLLAEG